MLFGMCIRRGGEGRGGLLALEGRACQGCIEDCVLTIEREREIGEGRGGRERRKGGSVKA
jgi:hypothetical protein